MDVLKQLTYISEGFLRHPALATLPTSSEAIPPRPFNLRLPQNVPLLDHDLQSMGCSPDAIKAMGRLLLETCYRLQAECQRIFQSTMDGLTELPDGEQQEHDKWEQSVAMAFQRKYDSDVADTRNRILHEVQLAKSRYSSTSFSPSPSTPSILSHPRLAQEASTEASGNFTEEVVGILHKAFETKATLTRAEVKSLSAVTHLNTKQVSIPFVLSQCRRR